MYEMNIRVRYSETNQHGEVEAYQILDYFQDSSVFHTMSLGLGLGKKEEEDNAWYLLAWDIRIKDYPKLGDELKVVTKPYKMKGFYGYRRFYLYDSNNTLIADADSVWVYMNTKQSVPSKIPDDITKTYIPEEIKETVRVKRKLSSDGNWEEAESFDVTGFFVDTNMHVNNAFYVQWAEELLKDGEKPSAIRVEYRHSAFLKDCIHIFISKEEDIFKVKFENQKKELLAIIEMTL